MQIPNKKICYSAPFKSVKQVKTTQLTKYAVHQWWSPESHIAHWTLQKCTQSWFTQWFWYTLQINGLYEWFLHFLVFDCRAKETWANKARGFIAMLSFLLWGDEASRHGTDGLDNCEPPPSPGLGHPCSQAQVWRLCKLWKLTKRLFLGTWRTTFSDILDL